MVKYHVRWDSGSEDYMTCRGAAPELCAEAGRKLINHWAKVSIFGTLVQIAETPIYRHPAAPEAN